MLKNNGLTIIGRAEKMDIIDHNVINLPVKIDTGADTSSIWASKVEKVGKNLHVVLFDEKNPYYTGEIIVYKPRQYTTTRVAKSFGVKELRYKVKLKVRILERTINATFSLADRSKKLYPVLIGRSLLNKKFLVDVSKGHPLARQEKQRARALKKVLSDAEGDI
jgi:hypothetical protein